MHLYIDSVLQDTCEFTGLLNWRLFPEIYYKHRRNIQQLFFPGTTKLSDTGNTACLNIKGSDTVKKKIDCVLGFFLPLVVLPISSVFTHLSKVGDSLSYHRSTGSSWVWTESFTALTARCHIVACTPPAYVRTFISDKNDWLKPQYDYITKKILWLLVAFKMMVTEVKI